VEPMEFSGLFQNLSKMKNLEKLHLLMLPGHRFDKKKMLQGLPKLKKLHKFIVRPKNSLIAISFTEYKQFNGLE